MFIMCGYNFCRDENTLDASPIIPNQYTDVKLTNGIFDHWNVSRDVSSSYSSDIPTAWDYLTVMNANFNGNIDAGNFSEILSNIDGFKVKRRKTTEFDWVTLKYIPIEDTSELYFAFQDNLAQSGVEYEYAFVPVVNQTEGSYITNTIYTKFDGVFICDIDTVYRFYAGVEYGGEERVQKVGVFEPYGRKYPVIVSNGVIGYSNGSVKGTVLQNTYLSDKILDRTAMVTERKELLNFLTNKKAKILKDWNGNCWLMIITGNPNINYETKSGMALADVEAHWTEVGDADNHNDLYSLGVVEEAE